MKDESVLKKMHRPSTGWWLSMLSLVMLGLLGVLRHEPLASETPSEDADEGYTLFVG